MTRKNRLQTIKTLAESTETIRSRVVSARRSALRDEEDRLEQLERYRTEYQSMNDHSEQSVCINSVRDRRSFMQRLNEAIENQRRVIAHTREQLDACLDHWRDARAKSMSLQKFSDRLSAQENLRLARREQSELDDIGRKMEAGKMLE